MNESKVLFLGKKNDSHCNRALQFLKLHFLHVEDFYGEWGSPFPKTNHNEIIISYLSRWIVPENILSKSKLAINFHPGTPDYPGIGCNNFALYEDAKEYGSTCHHMKKDVDTGDIVAVKRFPVYHSDNVQSILERTYDYQLMLFYEIISKIGNNEDLPTSKEKWTKKPTTRKQFNKLFEIKKDMNKKEVERVIRSTSYNDYQPYIKLHGYKFKYDLKNY